MSDIHNRMPCILLKGNEKNWLNPKLSFEEVKQYLHPYPDNQMAALTVSKRVNNPANNDEGLTEYFEYELKV